MKENKYLYFGEFEGKQGIVLESRGGSQGSVNERNSNYKENLDQLIKYLITNRKEEIVFYLAAEKSVKNTFTDLSSRIISFDGKEIFNYVDLQIGNFRIQLNKHIKIVGTLDPDKASNSTRKLFITYSDSDFNVLLDNKSEDELEYVYQKVKKRIKQSKFRKELLLAYDNTCAVTGSKVDFLLEAAHIVPYFGERSNVISNGILLRSDIHDLFDLYVDGKRLLNITKDYIVEIHPSLIDSEYGQFNGKKILLPSKEEWHPEL